MCRRLKEVEISMLPGIFKEYQDSRYQFFYVKDFMGSGKQGIFVGDDEDIRECENEESDNWKITRMINTFDEIDPKDYEQMAELFRTEEED